MTEEKQQPESPGRSDEAHDKPQGEGLGAPDKAEQLPEEGGQPEQQPVEDTGADELESQPGQRG